MATPILPPDEDLGFHRFRNEGFPVYSLNRDQRRKALQRLLRYDRTQLIKGGVLSQTMHGLALAWHYHPHAFTIRCGKMLTPQEVFGDDDRLRNSLKRRLKLGSCLTQSDLRKALKTFSGAQGVSNFRPTAAAAIYDRYLPERGGVTWDMSSGFGGRLLGAIASSRVLKYIGTDPATLTMDGLLEMSDDLPSMAEQFGFPNPEIELHKMGSEDFAPDRNSVDLAFTSPPYWNTEKYSDEQTQSYIKFPSKEEWLNGFMAQTLANCHYSLVKDGMLVINIANVPTYPALADDFVALASRIGFKLQECLRLALSALPGTRNGESHKYEPILAFVKTG